MSKELAKLKASLSSVALDAHNYFSSKAQSKNKVDWDKKGGLNDNGKGAVYAFFSVNGKCLYVGQTTQSLKQRANVKTSKHYDAEWWKKWKTLRFINIENRTDQLILEMLLIIHLEPSYNIKPASRKIADMFNT